MAARVEVGAKAAPRGFIIAVTQRGRLRRVHYGGGCFRKPGEHYLEWEELGDRAPEAHEFNARCCQPKTPCCRKGRRAGSRDG